MEAVIVQVEALHPEAAIVALQEVAVAEVVVAADLQALDPVQDLAAEEDVKKNLIQSSLFIKFDSVMKKTRYIFIAMLLMSTMAMGQNFSEALRLSNYQIQGTAHSMAMGNAIGAIGGDFASLSINPAGIAVYQTNEFTFTPTFNFNKSELNIDKSSFSDNNFKFNFGQLGYVSSSSLANTSSIVRFNFGVGFNRLADFNQVSMGSYGESSSSFLDGIANYSTNESLSKSYLGQSFNQVEYRDWNSKLAWDTYLIDPIKDGNGDEIDGEYVSILYEGETVNQHKSWESNGGINEYLISGGLNFNHKFYLGATIGIHDLYYNRTSYYSEKFSDDSDSFSYVDDYDLSGTGYVFKLGAIYKPISSIRFGLAFHTPTYYVLDEESNLSMESNLSKNYYSSGTNLFSYNFYTPLKAIFSGAFVISKAAILSFDAEYVDYSAMRYRDGSNNDPMTDVNTDIDNSYNQVFNYRLGGEVRVSKALSLQAGYELYANPFKSDATLNGGSLKNELSSISAGIGYSNKSFYFDTAYKYSTASTMVNDVQPNYSNLPLDFTNQKLIMSFGFRF